VQQPDPLAGDQGTEPAHSGGIAARPVEAGNVALAYRVAAGREHDRNGFGRRHGSQHRSAASCRGDHVDLAADQIGGKSRQSIMPVFCKTVFDRDVAAIDIAAFAQAAPERRLDVGPVILPLSVQEPDHRRRRLLRARRQRPRYRAAECGQQFPPSDGDIHPSRARCVRQRYHVNSVQSSRQGGRSPQSSASRCRSE
jgi:hypothetical protein